MQPNIYSIADNCFGEKRQKRINVRVELLDKATETLSYKNIELYDHALGHNSI